MEPCEIERVPEDHPNRCQASGAKGQCINKAVPGGKYCLVHGGNKELNRQEKENIRNYQLAKFKSAFLRQADSPVLKTLHEEVAILRMVLENQINKCKDDTDLMLNSHVIGELVVKIEKVVKSCHSLESSLGGVLDKGTLLTFSTKIIDIISREIEDTKTLNRISQGILDIVKDTNGSTEADS